MSRPNSSGQSFPRPTLFPASAAILCFRALLLCLALSATPLCAQIATRDVLVQEIERLQALPAADLAARINRLPEADRNAEIFLCFARLRISVPARNVSGIQSDLRRILAAADAIGDESTLQIVYSELANTLTRADDPASLTLERDHALKRARAAPNFPIFQIFSSLGEAFRGFYDYADAGAAYDLAGQHLNGQPDQSIAAYYTRYATVLIGMGRLDSALDSFQRARSIYAATGHIPVQLLVDNADLELTLRHYDAAQKFIDQAIQLTSPRDPIRTRFGVQETSARILTARKQFPQALECIHRAEALAPADDFMLQHATFALYQDLYFQSHNYAALPANARAMLASAQASGNERAISYAKGLLGLALGLNGEVEKGLQLIDESERENLSRQSGRVDNLEQRYLVYEAAHRYPEALKAYRDFRDAQQEWSERTGQQIATLRTQEQLVDAEKLRQQLLQAQHNQHLELEYLARRSQFKGALAALLFVSLLLAVALAWSLWRVNIVSKQQALEDSLTGLKNRRFLTPFMEVETARLRRSGFAALVIMADIDHFKSVNDRWGHEAGDDALVQITEVLRNCVRNADVVARWGGEEFVIICPRSTEEHAALICNRIQHQLRQTSMLAPGGVTYHLTLSIGAALFSPAILDEHWETALARADQALYLAKHSGRNKWILSPTPSSKSDASPSAAV
jgi:diguanylate cyclase (GGDEF)-like protein